MQKVHKPQSVDNRIYSQEQLEFIKAMQEYMTKYDRKFPSFTEVLEVAKSLGYRKVSTDGTAI